MSNPVGGKWLDAGMRTECLLLEQKCEFLQEKLDVMTLERDKWKHKAESLHNVIVDLIY